MRLHKEVVAKREEFIREAVKADPKATGAQLQDLLAQHFGRKMRPNRLYAIRREALGPNLDLGSEFAPHPPDPYDP